MIRLLWAVAFFLTGCFAATRADRPVDVTGFAILQGATDAQTTEIAVLHAADEVLRFARAQTMQKRPLAPDRVETRRYGKSPWVVSHLTFSGLAPEVPYQLKVIDGTGSVRDERTFKALPTQKKSARLAVVSCLDDAYEKEQREMAASLLAKKPDVLFFLGDNVYADRPTLADPHQLWRRYVETRLRLQLFRKSELVPVFATWDDHDYGVNDGDRTYPHRDEARRIFESFFPQRRVASGIGVSSQFEAFGQQFLLLDDRTFRSPPGEQPETHWGMEQEKWVFEQLQRRSGPFWLMNGSQFFGGYHPFESYERQHPESFRALIQKIRESRALALFVSGDRHLSEIIEVPQSELGYRSVEITSSAWHARTYPGSFRKHPNPRQLAGVDGIMNYVIVDIEPAGQGLKLSVTAYGPQEKVLFQRTLTVAR